MHPRLGSAITVLAVCATADPSRWTHRVGVTGRARRKITPTRNAIGLSSPVGAWLTVAMGELSPWRSVLPPLRVEGPPSTQGEAEYAVKRIATYPRVFGPCL